MRTPRGHSLDPGSWTGPGDGECTHAPDAILGVELTPACRVHDASPLDPASHLALGVAVLGAFVAAWAKHGLIGRLAVALIGRPVAGAYAAATTLWQLLKGGNTMHRDPLSTILILLPTLIGFAGGWWIGWSVGIGAFLLSLLAITAPIAGVAVTMWIMAQTMRP